jgi:hypothetical protein
MDWTKRKPSALSYLCLLCLSLPGRF